MSRNIVDRNLLTWEVFATGGRHGLPDEPKIVFQCLSDRTLRPRFVRRGGDSASAQGAVQALDHQQLLEMLDVAEPLN
jgi:hypothetical protein